MATTRITVFLITALAFAAPAGAADDEVYVKYRQKVMSGVGADMGAISDILKNGLPFTASVALHAARLEDAASLIPTAFERRVVDGATDAKPGIWEQPEKFIEATRALSDAADDLEDAASDGDADEIQAAFKQLGKACGGCHKTFRKPKEESYKNR